jgi:hypothetical protein
LPALRKWLLNDMQDDDGDSVSVAWPRSFWSWFKDNKHPQELLNKMFEGLLPVEDTTEASNHAVKPFANAKEAAAKLRASPHIQLVSFPEGTLAAALERWLVEGKELQWSPDDQILIFTIAYTGLLRANLQAANSRRKSLLEPS